MRDERIDVAIVCAGYPTPKDPTNLPFIDQLVCAWADIGLSVCVICPVTRFVRIKDRNKFYKKKWMRTTEKGNSFLVYHPRYWGFGAYEENHKSFYEMGYKSFHNALKKILNHLLGKPVFLYSHFLTAGRHVGDLSEEYGIPGFCAFGESTLWSVNAINYSQTKSCLDKLKGIIAVSSENKKVLVQSNLCSEEKIYTIPNAVNTHVFFPHEKKEMRIKYRFPETEIIGIFVGAFCERKGVLRVQEAAQKANLKMIYVGSGEEEPIGNNIVYKGSVPHALISEYLSAADFFVLPTRAEGCCNSIIEALACGLPVISSDLGFNDDILNNDYSIRIDPDNISQIQRAMESLANDDDLRNRMAQSALEMAKTNSIEIRARKIMDFMAKN